MPTQLSTVFISSTALDLGPHRDRLSQVARRLIFLVDDSVPWLPAMIDGGDAAARLQTFKESLRQRHPLRAVHLA